MIHRDPERFYAAAANCPPDRPGFARAAFLVAPHGLRLAEASASDNLYMDLTRRVDGERALAQHAGLQRALADCLPTLCFPGDPATPDAVFPNNVFASARCEDEATGRFIIGRMRHPLRQREAERSDIPRFFNELLGYRTIDLRTSPGLSELTGTLVIDRARGLGYAGLSPRCDPDGVAAMHAAFGLRETLAFALAPGEYHTNVVMSALGGRGLVIGPTAFVDPAVPAMLQRLYGDATIVLDAAELASFAGNCIALDPQRLWLSEAAADGLAAATRAAIAAAGWRLGAVALDEIEKAGGSLRCCVAEIF